MSDTNKPEPSASELPAQRPVARPESEPKPEPRPEPKLGPPPNLEVGRGFGGAAPRLRDLDREIEKELEASLGGLSEKEIFGEPQRQQRRPPAGTEPPGPKKGKVLRVHNADVFIDVPGGRSQGMLPLNQFPEGPPAPGTEVEIHIEGYDAANGLLLLSRRGAAVHADWSSVSAGMTVEARVTGVNKGGLEVDVNGIRGFMPISQIDLYRVERPEDYVNQKLLCMVSEVNPAERNLVVSRRDLLEKQREELREKFWNEVAEGQVREGVVRSVREFGAFVDLGGADGLLHVSEMSWSRVKDPNSVVQPGQAVKVVVLRVDRERRKLSLGLKQLAPSPWDTILDRYSFNSVVKGKVTRLTDFGAFVELEPGVEGLIHVSELSPQRVRRVADVVQPDQEVTAKVLNIDPGQRRISLSLKAATAPEEEAAEEEEAAAEGKPPRPRTTPLRGGLGRE